MSFLKNISFSFWNKSPKNAGGKVNSKPHCRSNSAGENEFSEEKAKRIAELAAHTAATKYGSTIARLAKE